MLSRRMLFLMLFILVVCGLGAAIHYSPDWSWIVEHEQSLRSRVSSAPVVSWCVGLVAYFLLSLIPGSAGKSVAFGWFFGFWGALLMVEVGLTSAAIASFLLARLVLGEVVNHSWRQRLQVFRQRFTHDGAIYLLLLRLAHAPFTLVNYGAGATGVPLSAFIWTTLVGILPGTMVFVFAGSRIPSLKIVAERGVWALVDFRLFMALLATATLPLAIRTMVRFISRRIQQANVQASPESRGDELMRELR